MDGPSPVEGVVRIALPVDAGTTELGLAQTASLSRPFIAGPENRLVEVAVRAVVEGFAAGGPCEGFNPVCFFGPSGSGKTHLAEGLARACPARGRRAAALCAAAIDFARELTDAIETQTVKDFRRRYRSTPLLILDDVGRLADRPAAQQELIGTLDSLAEHGRGAVLTAHARPTAIPGLDPRLASRLVAGLTIELAPPGPAARRALLEWLGTERALEITDEAADLLAAGPPATVPELIGNLVQLEAIAQIEGRIVDAAMVRARADQLGRGRQPPLRDIAQATARSFSLRLAELRSRSRSRAVVTARGVAMYLARTLTENSLSQIGEYFGGRDHTTVLHGCRATERLIRSEPAIRQIVEQLQEKLQGHLRVA